LTLTGPWSGSHTVAYGYDEKMRLDSITDFGGGVTTLTHNDDGALDGVKSPALTTDIVFSSLHTPIRKGENLFSYTPRGQVYDRSIRDSLEFERYSYDRGGRLKSRTRLRRHEQICAINSDGFEECTTDPLRPTQIDGTVYGYDAAGNRTDGNAVLAAGNRVTSAGGYTFTYDDDGNVTGKYKTGYVQDMTWNSLGEMTSLTVNGTRVDYAYDALGRWAKRTYPGGSSEYVYDGDNLLLERDHTGAIAEFTYLPGVDQPHSMRRGGQTYYYELDEPGSVTAIWRSDRVRVNQYRYTPWGERVWANETGVANPLQYVGRHYEPHAGIYQMRARWYDPQLGRFLSEDPMGLAGGINPFAYAGNNPTNATDPFGLYPVCRKQNGFKNTITFGEDDVITVAEPAVWVCHEVKSWWDYQEAKAVPGSFCEIFKCQLTFATRGQRTRALAAAGRIQDEGFCGQIKRAATEMINRELLIINNRPRIPEVDDPRKYRVMAGEAPFDPRFGAPVMYLRSDLINTRVVAHEGVHGVMNTTRRFQSMWGYYSDGEITPMGVDVDSSSKLCSRG
jgi:RHS repeat-associated protein